MLLIFWSTFEFSARISASPGSDGPGATVPSIRPELVPPALLSLVPAVIKPRGDAAPVVGPDELAVPKGIRPWSIPPWQHFQLRSIVNRIVQSTGVCRP